MSTFLEVPVCARIPTIYGEFQLCLYRDKRDQKEHLAIVRGEVAGKEDILLRVHSECFTGDVLGSLRCDCGEQLDCAMQMIAEDGVGVILYLRQEGRGIGLFNKLLAYNLQDQGLDTVDANLALGHQADERNYTVAAEMIQHLEIGSIRLMTNNPHKTEALQALGIKVTRRVPILVHAHPENEAYLRTKAERMRHILHLDPELDVSTHQTNTQDKQDLPDGKGMVRNP